MRWRSLALKALAGAPLLLGMMLVMPSLAMGTPATPNRRVLPRTVSASLKPLGVLPIPAAVVPQQPAPQPPRPVAKPIHWTPPVEGAMHFRTSYKGPTKGSYKHCPKWSTFGKVRGGTKFHGGLDISAPTGTPVHAATDGTLSYARDPDGYGLFARVKFSAKGPDVDEYEIIYAHLVDDNKKLNMNARPVKAGEIIGKAGCTGNAKGMCSPSPESHVHVTINKYYKNKKTAVDPLMTTNWSISTPGEAAYEGLCR